MKGRRWLLATLAVWLSGAGAVVAADPPVRRLVIGLTVAPTTVDPHAYVAAFNIALAQQVFDTLTRPAPLVPGVPARMEPALARSYRRVAPDLWEFVLRDDARFSDGSPVTADDVAFSFARSQATAGGVATTAILLTRVRAVEVTGPLTLLIRTHGFDPTLPLMLSRVAVVSRRAAAGADSAAFDSLRASLGSGPFRVVRFLPGAGVELERNEHWWGGPVPWTHVRLMSIPNGAARTAALLAGDVDVIDQPEWNDHARLRAAPGVAITSRASTSSTFLQVNRMKEPGPGQVSGPDGEVLAANPLDDLRVRQALSLALNRAALADRIGEGAATPSGQIATAGAVGFNPDIVPPVQDVQQARALLAEAGFPNGLRVKLLVPSDRIVWGSSTGQAVAQMWARIGVRTEVDSVPWPVFVARGARGQFGLRLFDCCNQSGDDAYYVVSLTLASNDRVTGRGGSNYGRYVNQALDAAVASADEARDEEGRAEKLRLAVRIGAEDLGVIPVLSTTKVWASGRGIRLTPRDDGLPAAIWAELPP